MVERVSVVGLGKLGMCLAACFAESGVHTIGIDVNAETVNAVRSGKSPIVEPGLDESIAAVAGKTLFAETDAAAAITGSDITYVLVNTPSNPDGSFSNRSIEEALTSLGTALRASGKPSHIFVISSTVMPGSITGSFIPLLERATGRKLHGGFEIAYCPDFVALGQVMKDFHNPDFILVGEGDAETGMAVENLHKKICRNNPPVRRMSLTSAEIAKVSLNAFITMKISFANTIGNICEKTPDANVDDITSAIGLDKRISPYYLRSGLSFGGTCFPRDTRAFRAVAERINLPAHLMDACEAVNRIQDDWLAEAVCIILAKTGGRVAILGLSFKPNTPVIEKSPGVALAGALMAKGIELSLYDPLALAAAKAALGDGPRYHESAAACLKDASVAVLTVGDAGYREAVYRLPEGKKLLVLDCWRQLDATKIPGGVTVRNWGKYCE